MPVATNGEIQLHYEIDGDGPPVMLLGDVGLGAWQFGWQYAALAGPYRVITPETRGIGESTAAPGPITIRGLATDVDAILGEVGARTVHLVGYGLGGMVALAYALESNRPASLTVVGTPPSGDVYTAEGLWADPDDPDAIRASLEAVLSPAFRADQPDVLEQLTEWRIAEDATPDVFAAQRAAIDEFDVGDRLYELTTPTLVLHGTADTICPVEHGERLAEGLPRGTAVPIEDAGHLVHIERSRTVNDELRGWLDDHAEFEY